MKRLFFAMCVVLMLVVGVFKSSEAKSQPPPVQGAPVWELVTLPNPSLPNILCIYDMGSDTLIQVIVNNGQSYHLNPDLHSRSGRTITPGDLIRFHGNNDFMNRCDILLNGSEMDAPLTLPLMLHYHFRHMQYELTHTPVPANF